MQIDPIRNHVNADLTAQQAQKAQQAQEAKLPLQEKPVEQAAKGEFYQEPDQYSHKEPEPASGLYRQVPGEEGPKVDFDAPEDAQKKAPANKKAEGRLANVTTTNTDEVDREIERARKKVEDLQARVGRAQEGPERERLEKQLKQAESELERKDNDTYRRQHAKIS